jgi:hypothetical protein
LTKQEKTSSHKKKVLTAKQGTATYRSFSNCTPLPSLQRRAITTTKTDVIVVVRVEKGEDGRGDTAGEKKIGVRHCDLNYISLQCKSRGVQQRRSSK